MDIQDVLSQDLSHCEGCENFYTDACANTCAHGIHRKALEKQIALKSKEETFGTVKLAFCPKCGELLGKFAEHCEKCGQRVEITR